MGETDADGAGAPRRRVSLFDPLAGMRAMADIQAEGLRAAGELLDRVLGSESGPRPRPRPPTGEYTALVDAWADLLRRIAAGMSEPVQANGVTVPVDTNGVGPPVRLRLGESGNADGAVAEVWLHNGTFAPVGPLTLRCGQLSSSDGEPLEGAEVRFEPAEVAQLPPRSSRGVRVSVAAPGSLRPGIYRGTIQADGAPRLWLPLELTIDPC
jgi:hypothetical protein